MYSRNTANPWFTLAAALGVGLGLAGCQEMDMEVDGAETTAAVAGELEAAACTCDHGWDYWGNPIPPGITGCGYSVCGLDDKLYACGSSGWYVQSASSCNGLSEPLDTKLGVNSATTITSSCTHKSKTAGEGMGHYLELAYSENDKYTAASAVQCAIDSGVLPIIRICSTGSCGFQDVNSYVRFLKHIDDQVNGVFYAIAGANEPLTEKWIPGTENVTWKGYYSAQDINTLAYYNTQYMNSVISGLGSRRKSAGGQIGLLSPALNCTNGYMPQLVDRMGANGANFTALSGIAGNAYNVNTAQGLTISKYVADCRYAFTSKGIAAPHDYFYITEIGAYESERNPIGAGVPHATALDNLRAQVDLLRADRKIRGALFFNAYGTNPDSNFDYGEIADSEWPVVLGSGPASCPCSSDPSFDNFCYYGSSTPNCPMTFPGGYCDPNANGSYDDADWTQGWYDYSASCP